MTDGFSFSAPLKLRLAAYFRNTYDLDVKDEEADLFLRSLATVYDALSKSAGREAARGRRPRRPTVSRLDY